MTRLLRSSVTLCVATLLVLVGVGSAWAYWSASGTKTGNVAADAFPTTAGTKPGAAVSGGTVTLTFPAVSTTGGQPASGYTIKRFDSTGAAIQSSTSGSCSTASGSVTCTAGSVPDGQWTFGYQPLLSNWLGKDSILSDPVFADSTAPSITTLAIGPSSASGVGFIHQGGTYYVYANASDAVSGVGSVRANVATVTTGSTSVALTTSGGPFAVGSTTYSYRSAQLTANSSLSAGSKSFSVTATDNASNSATANSSVTVDNTAPATPTGLDMTTATDSGSSSTDNITNFSKPSFTGSADANTTVKIYDGTTEVGSGTSSGTGSFIITLTTALTDGAHTITAKAIDAADNLSSPSNSVSVVVDTVAPTASALAATNQGTLGQIDKNGSNRDTLDLTFSENMAASSVVAGWNGSGTQTVSVTFTNGGAANDSITIPGLGTIDLGSTTWLTSTSTKSESLTMTSATTFRLAIDTPPTNNTTGNAASTFAWSPTGSGATDVAGNAAVGSVQAASQRF